MRKRPKLVVIGPLVIGLILVISFGIVLLLGSRIGNQMIDRTVEKGGQAIIATTARSLFNDLYHLDVFSVENALKTLVVDETIVYAGVRDNSGQTLTKAETGWEPELKQLSEVASRALFQRETVAREIGNRYLAVAGPITAGSEEVGTLEIVFDRGLQQTFLTAMLRYLLAVLGVVFGASVIIGIVLTRYATKPLSSLSSVAEAIGLGNLDISVPVRGAQETAALGTAVDRMRMELKGLYIGLEQQVAERTHELTIANKELSRATEAAIEASVAKSQILSTVTHELKTPLTSIVGYADRMLLRRDTVGSLNERQERYLGNIQEDAYRLKSLIDDLLDISRIEAGSLELQLTGLDAQQEIEQAIKSLRGQFAGKQIQTQCNIPTNIVLVRADHLRLSQIIINLLTNAYKYSPEGAIVTITAEQGGELVQIDVSDTGIGMSDADQARLFTKFFRADNTPTRRESGTGLGLFITRHLVEAHGGSIWVESQEGKGSTFSFTLPSVAADAARNGNLVPAVKPAQVAM